MLRSLALAILQAPSFLATGTAAPPSVPGNVTLTRVAGVDIDSTTIPQLQELMNVHRLSSVQLVQFYLRRIEQLNPALHAVITVSATALADARSADQARRQGVQTPLLGIPVIV